MIKILAILILCITALGRSNACFNEQTMLLKNGTLMYIDKEGSVPYGHDYHTDEFEHAIQQLSKLYKETGDPDYASDKGYILAISGKYQEAIQLYLAIEKTHPNRYATASNIGTVYELAGQNENALKWIKKAVKINPASHDNSEWIHVKILEAKIKGEQFYTTNFLLNTEFGNEPLPNSKLNILELRALSEALFYQLNERISFVKPKEKIVAQLLFDLGNIAFLLEAYSDAKQDYEQAKKYGYAGQLFDKRIAAANRHSLPPVAIPQKIVDDQLKQKYLLYGLIGLITFTIITLVIFRLKEKRATKT